MPHRLLEVTTIPGVLRDLQKGHGHGEEAFVLVQPVRPQHHVEESVQAGPATLQERLGLVVERLLPGERQAGQAGVLPRGGRRSVSVLYT